MKLTVGITVYKESLEDLNFSISNSNTEANNFSQNLSRVDIIKIGFNFFEKFYLFGYGAGSFQVSFFLFY